MKEAFTEPIVPAYRTENEELFLGDTFELLSEMRPESVDMVFADPPYFLSNDGVSCHSGRMVSVNKGEWDKGSSFEAKHEFNRNWIRLCKTVLAPNGTIWISGTLHNIYSVGAALWPGLTLACLLAALAFVLSFDALRIVALACGVQPALAWMFRCKLVCFGLQDALAGVRSKSCADFRCLVRVSFPVGVFRTVPGCSRS